MSPFLLFLCFIIGTAVGSFLNVVAYRAVHGGSIFFGSSKCPHCQHLLKPADLIPIVSFLALRGRCRYCGKKISFQYPLVEAAGGGLFAFTFYYWLNLYGIQFLDILNLLFLLFVASVLLVLFVTDTVDGLLPNTIVLPAIAIVAAFKLIFLITNSVSISVLMTDLAASFLVASGFFAISYLSNEKALGGGDFKFVFFIALSVGWPSLLAALFSAFLTGGVVAAMLILARIKRFGQTVPLGPFLSIGGLVALFWGQQVIDIYLKFLL